MNFYSLFYWISVADKLRRFFDVASDWFTFFTIVGFLVCVIMFCAFSFNGDSQAEFKDEKGVTRKLFGYVKSFFYTSLTLCLLTWLAYIAVPSRKEAIVIVAGGAVGNYIQSDSNMRALPYELTQMLRHEISSASISEAINEQLSVDTLKSKSKEELIELIKEKGTK